MGEDALDRAVERTRREHRRGHARAARRRFRAHASIWLIVNVGLVAGWLVDRWVNGEQELWFLGSLFGWGAAVLAHWMLIRRGR